MIFLVIYGLRSTCEQSNSIIVKSSGNVARSVLSGNLPDLHNALGLLRIQSVSSLTFEGADSLDRDVFGRVVVGNPPAWWAYTCSADVAQTGLAIGNVRSHIDVPRFAVARLTRELASILFFWLLAIVAIVVSNYRALRVLGSINQSLESLTQQRPENLKTDMREDLAQAIASVPRNAGTQVVLDSLSTILDSLAEVAEIRLRLSRAEDKATLARQVGHDIRSPLSALRILMDKSKNLSEAEQNLLRACYDRVEKVAQDLLASAENRPMPASIELVSCISEMVREKQIQYSQVEWIFTSQARLSRAHAVKDDIQRILSNVMSNALEAHASTIKIHLDGNGSHHRITIADNGSGMCDNILAQIQDGLSVTTKRNGHGLGLSHARKSLRQIGGDLSIRRSIWNGVEVRITLGALGTAESSYTGVQNLR